MPSPYAEQIGRIEENVQTLVETCTEIKKQLEAANGRQRIDHDKITTLETRMGILAGFQAALTFVASAVAAWLGSRG